MVQLDSIVPVAGNFNVYVTLHIGAGVTGTQKGGEGDTRTFAFNFYGSMTLSDQGFSPGSVTGQFTGIPCVGAHIGSFMGSSYTIGYIDPGSVVPFVCVSSTAQCGNEHTEIFPFVFTVNELFDSLRVVGIEGSGNPVGGCYPDQDMLIDLTNIFDVDWSYFNASPEGQSVELEWGIFEFDAGVYEVLRGRDGEKMEAVGSLLANEGALEYAWRDENLVAGDYRYQLEHTSLNGGKSVSEVISVRVMEDQAGMVIAPSLVRDRAMVRYYATDDQARSLAVYNQEGREIFRQEIAGMEGMNELQMDLSGFAAGIYLVELRGGNSVEVKRIVHQ